jgi:uncharacterized protein (DUF362 family)
MTDIPDPSGDPSLGSRVGIATLPASYPPAGDAGDGSVAAALRRLTRGLGWSAEDRGAFGSVVPEGARVVVKPNWVAHQNQAPYGLDPLLTHPSLIRAVVDELLAGPVASVIVGDAPHQGCDLERLLAESGLAEWAAGLERRDARFEGVRDFRRTKMTWHGAVRETARDQRPMEHFVLFDLGETSLLEPITTDDASFRVTLYPPALMRRTHAPGRHQYLIAREVLDADVVINLPKLKTHKKAGVTSALKNLIGINGNKEFLPHHRVGGSESGGDCYPGSSPVKRTLEFVYDLRNSTDAEVPQVLLGAASRLLQKVAHVSGDRLGVEGSWSGNDTIWRTCLDLNRILVYGRLDGTLADVPQRDVLNVVDAVVAGHGDGPLAPQPLPLGMLVGGSNAAAVDWVSAQLLGYDPTRIPIAREAFGRFRWPLASFPPEAVTVVGDVGSGPAGAVLSRRDLPQPIAYPLGWIDAVAADRRGAVVAESSGAPSEA